MYQTEEDEGTGLDYKFCSICKAEINQIDECHYTRNSKDYCEDCVLKVEERLSQDYDFEGGWYTLVEALYVQDI